MPYPNCREVRPHPDTGGHWPRTAQRFVGGAVLTMVRKPQEANQSWSPREDFSDSSWILENPNSDFLSRVFHMNETPQMIL
ncbi:hypothetical protein IFM46972_06163 [Aspergillus udagawae]|uniref:Uncharacterized protein n=1 Tax=Aspergillus udagawae TaxID=91492 RepID=A0A8H3NU61_9EURO|nr:hypothetical protein IFM46972_06163 [Aspergillus udagawae]